MSEPENRLINLLDCIVEHKPEELHQAIFSERDVVRYVDRWVRSIASEEIFEMNRDNRVDCVQPTNFVLFARPGRFEILINHFDAKLYESSRNAPHFHHCDFATRVLCGGYMHVTYYNAGTLTQPDLSVCDMRWIGPDEGYSIESQTYHTVLRPIDSTLTLLVRGPQLHPRPNLSRQPYSPEMFASEFEILRNILGEAAAARA